MATDPPPPDAVKVSSPDKLIFPDDGITKAEVVAHYEAVADVMVPHVRGRPVSMQVFHGGIARRGHFMKQMPRSFPDWVARVTVPKSDGEVTHTIADNPATLVLLAQHNCITPHVFTSRQPALHMPDRLVIDLDPTEDDFAAVRRAARLVAGLVREAGLEPFAMVTGSRGIHVVAPLVQELDFDDVAPLTHELARRAAEADPDGLTTEFHKDKRGDRIYVDIARTRWAQTVVPPYALRPRPGAPVAVPVRWDEVASSRLTPDRWTLKTIRRRLGRVGDPWADIDEAAASPKDALRKLRA